MNDKGYFSKSFTLSLLISAAIILSTVLLSSFQGFNAPRTEADLIAAEVETLIQTTTWTDIFLNNFILTLVTFVPFFGIFFAVYVQYNTGYALGALSQVYNLNNVQATLITLTSPVGILEYSAYILALTESMNLVYLIYKKELKKRLVNQTWKTLIVVALLLLMGAVGEAFLIGRL